MELSPDGYREIKQESDVTGKNLKDILTMLAPEKTKRYGVKKPKAAKLK